MPVAVIFDVDGTLVNSVDVHTESWQRVLAEFGHDIPVAHTRAAGSRSICACLHSVTRG